MQGASKLFQEALRLDPHNSDLLDNLQMAQDELEPMYVLLAACLSCKYRKRPERVHII